MKKTYLYIGTLLIFSISFSCSRTTGLREGSPLAEKFSEERLNRIDAMIQDAIDKGWIAGASGLIVRNGRIVYDRAFGVSDIETGTPLRTDDIFRIASQTKAITSIAVMMLFEEGKFLLDDPVSRYIPEYANPGVLDKYDPSDTSYTTVPARREITIRDLLTHTSGIEYAGIGSDVIKAIYAKGGIPGDFGSDRFILGDKMKALGRMPLLHHPGDKWTYGMNIDVLGYLVEVLSGETLDEYFRNHIFEPLGMTDTYFYLPSDKISRLVRVNTEDENHQVTAMDPSLFTYPVMKGTYYSGGAGLSSTTRDYAAFLQMLLNKGEYNGKRLLSRRSVDLITSNQIGDLNVNNNKFGLGFEITTERGQTELGITEGSFSWGGYFGTTYWADPMEQLIGLLFIQQDPLNHSEIQSKFKAMVYQALDD
ncbi:MAG: beta-lactamase family protein [Bacteroidales bacterium]|nr:beta-lactamase family protein [Bacteroidales bacterium]